MAKAGEQDEEKIKYGIKHAEYVKKGEHSYSHMHRCFTGYADSV